MRSLPLTVLAVALLSSSVFAEKSAEEMAAELANPNTAFATMNFKNQFIAYDGDIMGAGDKDNYQLVFQPVFPFPREDGSKIIFRPSLSYIDSRPIPSAGGGFSMESGFGDIPFDLAFAPATDPDKLIAFGVVGTIPTASEGLGPDLWAVGPEFLYGKLSKTYVAGTLLTHQWDFAGDGDGVINLSSVQYFYTYLPGGGWNLGTGPIMTYDWENEQWNIPLQINAGKTVMFGGLTWKVSAEFNYFVETNDDYGQDWFAGINIAPVVANPLLAIFK